MIPCSWRVGIVTPKVTCLIKIQKAFFWAQHNPKSVCEVMVKNESPLPCNKFYPAFRKIIGEMFDYRFP